MSAKDQARAMIDQLMGTCKDGYSTKRSITFDDPRVCKPFLLGCCPNDILSATRVDLGECHKMHDLALKADYEKAAETRKDLDYEFLALDVLEEFVSDCDKKKETLKRKLKETQEELSEEAAKKMNFINEFGEQIGTKLAKAEELGNTGQVDESMKILEEIEQLKSKKAELEYEFRNSMPASTYQQQKLRVCDVCSAYLGIHDNDRRLADHFGGKLHLGFIHIREKLDELREKVKVLKERKLERRSKNESSTYRDRDKRVDYDRSRDNRRNRRSRSRSTSKSRKSKHGKNRSRSRSRSRDKHKSSHRKRSNSRDRKRHKRSRSRSTSRKHHRNSDSKKTIKSSHAASTGSSDHSRSTSPNNRVNNNNNNNITNNSNDIKGN